MEGGVLWEQTRSVRVFERRELPFCGTVGGDTNNPGQNSVNLLRSRWVIGVLVTYEKDMQYFLKFYVA